MESSKKSWICVICPLIEKDIDYYKSNNIKLGVRLVILEDDFGLKYLAAEVGTGAYWCHESGDTATQELGYYRRMRDGNRLVLKKIR